MMQKITEITRRSIFDIFLNGIDLDWGFETELFVINIMEE